MDGLRSVSKGQELGGRCAPKLTRFVLVVVLTTVFRVGAAFSTTVATGVIDFDLAFSTPPLMGPGTMSFCLTVPQCAGQTGFPCCGTVPLTATINPNVVFVTPTLHVAPNQSCCIDAAHCGPGLPPSAYWGFCNCTGSPLVCTYATCPDGSPGSCGCFSMSSCGYTGPDGSFSITATGQLLSYTVVGAYNQSTRYFGGDVTSATLDPSALSYLQAQGVDPSTLTCTVNGIPYTASIAIDGAGVHLRDLGVNFDCAVKPQAPTPTRAPTVQGQPTPTTAPTNTPLSGSANTGTGTDVQLSSSNTFISPQTGETVTLSSSIQFSSVTSPGVTTASLNTGSGGTVPPNFAVGLNGIPAVYVDVATTASYAPPITICLSYPDANNDGYVDGTNPPLPETSVRILHRENGTFRDSTDPSKTSYASNIVCATVASLSPFVQAAEINVPGGGNSKTACFTEFQMRRNSVTLGDPVAAAPYIPFSKGLPNAAKISCRDQDPCDADQTPGQCTFTVLACPNETDSRLAACAPTDVAKYVLKKPLPNAKDAIDAATANDILAKLQAMGSGTVGGKKGNEVTFSPSLATTECSDPISIVVPLKSTKQGFKKGTKVITMDAYAANGAKDANALKLTCNP